MTKQIHEYPIIMIGFGGVLGWLAHELFVWYKLTELGLL